MEKFLNITFSVLVSILTLFTIFVGVIYVFTLSLVNFVLCLPINLVKLILYIFKTKNK